MCTSAAAEQISHLYLPQWQQRFRQLGLSRPNATMPKNNTKKKQKKKKATKVTSVSRILD